MTLDQSGIDGIAVLVLLTLAATIVAVVKLARGGRQVPPV